MWPFNTKGKSLNEHVKETKTLKIRGIHFKITRLGVLDHLNGSTVLTENYHLYKSLKDSDKKPENALKTIQKHYRDVFMSSVIEPNLSRDKDCGPGETFVDNIFIDMDIAHQLYVEIMIFTHGKKKMIEALGKLR